MMTTIASSCIMLCMLEKNYYTVEEFAELFDMTPLTIRRSIKSGRILAIRVGSSKKSAYRIPRSQIEKLAVQSYMEITNKEFENE